MWLFICQEDRFDIIVFVLSVVSVDYVESSGPDPRKIPCFHEIQETYSKELESFVLFPDLSSRQAENKGNTVSLCAFLSQANHLVNYMHCWDGVLF